MEEGKFDNLEIYIAYKRLKAKDLALYLNSFALVAEKVTEDYMFRFGDRYISNEDFPYLEVNSIHTGNSIKFTLTEGWKPSFGSDAENDIVIGMPKKLGIPLVVGYLLITSAGQYQDMRMKSLEIQTKEIELQLKKTELAKALSDNSHPNEAYQFQTKNYLQSKVPEAQTVLLDTVKNIIRNPDITKFKVNNIDIVSMDKY